MTPIETLKQFTVVVADSGDIDAIRQFSPEDATTNPSLILKAAALPQYQALLAGAVAWAKAQGGTQQQLTENAGDKLAVNIGCEILKSIPGRISTEVDARLSYDSEKCIAKARQLIALYREAGVDKSRILIKLAATWEGIKAAEQLEKEGINTNLTLLFSFAQARACAEAGAYLISPFVGRIYDWYQTRSPQADYSVATDQGVASVRKIFAWYKQHGYRTVVMGASFRRIEQILALSGCDRLTISPALLAELEQSGISAKPELTLPETITPPPAALSEAEFRWQHSQDAMAVEKLTDGIRLFAADQLTLEAMLAAAF
ncbi:transaldolase [Pantoea sp. B65]|uniref:transaldolase n=1 Tax=Pantoea sp. B65 TaxID=2813359 RepID=UPI0039B39014